MKLRRHPEICTLCHGKGKIGGTWQSGGRTFICHRCNGTGRANGLL